MHFPPFFSKKVKKHPIWHKAGAFPTLNVLFHFWRWVGCWGSGQHHLFFSWPYSRCKIDQNSTNFALIKKFKFCSTQYCQFFSYHSFVVSLLPDDFEFTQPISSFPGDGIHRTLSNLLFDSIVKMEQRLTSGLSDKVIQQEGNPMAHKLLNNRVAPVINKQKQK